MTHYNSATKQLRHIFENFDKWHV